MTRVAKAHEDKNQKWQRHNVSGTVTGNDSVSALLVERKQRKMLISCSTDDTEIRAFFCASVFTGKVCGDHMANVVTQGRYPEQNWEKQVGEY